MNESVDQPLPVRTSRGFIFAVDDDENDRLILERLVLEAQHAYTCRTFRAGEELLDALIEVLRGAPPPVACFIDIKMNGMSGLDVLRWIRAQRSLDTIPIVVLSSSDDPQFLAEAHQVGAQCYTTKFPSPQHLAEIIAAAERYCAAAGCNSAFPLACNLLVGTHVST